MTKRPSAYILLIVKRLPAIAFYSLCAYVILLIAQQMYYKLPGSWWLNYYNVRVQDTPVGQPVEVTLCRHLREHDIDFDGTRSFYTITAKGQRVDAGQYQFKANAEDGQTCQDLSIPVKKQPQQPGTYQFHTEDVFYIHGNRKVIEYTSEQYKIYYATPQDVQNEINTLEQQIQRLEAQLSALNGGKSKSTETPVASDTNVTNKTSPPAASNSTSVPSVPVAQSTPPATETSPPITTPAPSVVQQVLNPVTTVVQNLVHGLGL